MNLRTFSLPIVFAVTCLTGTLHAEVKLSRLFAPHMVLQRDMAVPVYGTAAPGEKVTVSFRGQTKTAEADKDGKWSVKLDPLKAGGPDILTINEKKIDEVLVGEVWVGSGQSNMAGAVRSYAVNDPVLAENAKGTYPKLRLLTGGGWQVADPTSIAGFSAIHFSFGHQLQKDLDVPVGLMVGAVGGTPSGHWLTEEMYRGDAACTEAMKKFAATYNFDAEVAKHEQAKVKYERDLAAWKVAEEAAKKAGEKPPNPLRAPQPPARAGEASSGRIGHLFEAHIRPFVGYGIQGVFWDQGESRTAIVGAPQYQVMGALIKGWRKLWGQGEFPFLYVQKPSGGGCAWDYNSPMMSQGDKFVPQPTAVPPPPNADYSHAYYTSFMQHPKTYMVTASDLGPNTHPINKSGYGARAAYVAMNTVYGGKAEFCGPLYASHVVEGNKARIKFSHTGKGLAFKNGDRLQGFAVAGADKKFVWADAVIDGQSVVVSAKGVEKPEAVRYAWSQTFPWANLFNQDGLPTQPFRTDSW